MLKILASRLRQGHRTNRFPVEAPALPDRFRGRPVLRPEECPTGCDACARACPTRAITLEEGLAVDLGRCLFCTECTDVCPRDTALVFSGEYRLATRTSADLVVRSGSSYALAEALEARALALFGRSLKLRVVSAGGCNGCEVDVNVLGTVGWDLGRFGIQVVASPRHADAVVICGPITRNMEAGLRKTLDATPDPKLVIAVGACALSGGPYLDQEEQLCGAPGMGLPVDLFIPGCPPHPLTILDGLLRLLDKVGDGGRG
ncbi:NADH-quinone oxidoreductase subunit B family protein [Mesoterricola sediminis]|uniref:Hydrogenase n=1 Tax=Mesoterricola sediminis TaxID=2927980 RepID=A0AA48GQL7_9BACT|nr:4Fe-4S dicluster domain-containing protein [Mesoterricola sediminis]BDU75777.1 hydrogenase [Mesoterricola sediminis]